MKYLLRINDEYRFDLFMNGEKVCDYAWVYEALTNIAKPYSIDLSDCISESQMLAILIENGVDIEVEE